MRSSWLREAYRMAVLGRQKSIGAEAFPERSVEAAEAEVSRTLGEQATRRPTFELLETVLVHGNPAPVLDAIAERCRVRWERVPESEAASLARIAEHVQQLELGIDAVREELRSVRERRPPIAKVPPRGAGERTA